MSIYLQILNFVNLASLPFPPPSRSNGGQFSPDFSEESMRPSVCPGGVIEEEEGAKAIRFPGKGEI